MLNDWFDEVIKKTEDFLDNASKEEILEELRKSNWDFYKKHGINFIDYSVLRDEEVNEKRFVIIQEDNTHMENEIEMKNDYSECVSIQGLKDKVFSFPEAA